MDVATEAKGREQLEKDGLTLEDLLNDQHQVHGRITVADTNARENVDNLVDAVVPLLDGSITDGYGRITVPAGPRRDGDG